MLRAFVRQLFSGSRGAEANRRRGAAARERLDWDGAIRHYLVAVSLDDHRADAWNDLGLAYCAKRQFAQAREAYTRALSRNPRLFPAALNLGHLLRVEYSDFASAERCYRQALEIEPGNAAVLTWLGLALQELGRVAEAIGCYRRALEIDPRHEQAGEYILFALNLIPGMRIDQVFDEHLRWAAVHADAVPRLSLAPRAAGRWRVGFVSGDFRAHSTMAFVLPLLENLDRSRFEIFCYSTTDRTDAATMRFRAVAEAWHEIHAMSDEAAAACIRDGAVDVLVDLSGHTLGNRLGIFARKPAPVTLTWLGYLNTTGMAAMDCRLGDRFAEPEGVSDRCHRETMIRLPRTQWCYSVSGDVPEVEPRTAGRPLTFGSCNHIAKLNEDVISAWSEILGDIPGSRLLLMAVPGAAARERIESAFSRRGISRHCLDTYPRVGGAQYWRLLASIDIALDTFPYAGGATTCDCLWMGVPVVTLAGAFGFARSGVSILENAGLPELVAADTRQYRKIAVALGRDAAQLASLRAGLRARMRASPLMDAVRFARDFEQAVLRALGERGVVKPC